MRQRSWHVLIGLALITCSPQLAESQEVTFDNLVEPAPNDATESLSSEMSFERAAHFLDSASLNWQAQHGCMTCHTNYAYLYARPFIGSDGEAHREVRSFAEQLVDERWPKSGPRWDAEVVATAAALAFNDSATSGQLHPATRKALDRMWTVQREDGGWTWLKCGWPPLESDDHYGVTLAAIAVGVAPESYRETDAAQTGLDQIKKYFDHNPPESLHHRAMLVWAASYVEDLISDEDRAKCVDALLALQNDDGGWGVATLGDWDRADGLEQDLESSDGYGTGFVVYVLRRSGLPATHPSIAKGIDWLTSHQRTSGRWFTRSLNRDGTHYLTHAGSAMAIMALGECNVIQ